MNAMDETNNRVLRVAVKFSLRIDERAWMDEYGLERGEVREDVQIWVENLVDDALHQRGLGEVHVKVEDTIDDLTRTRLAMADAPRIQIEDTSP